MKVTTRKIILLIIITTLVAILIPTKVQAAGSYGLSKGSASITTGGTTTVTVTTSGCEGKFSVSSSNTSVATVDTSSFWGDEKGTTITITAISAGSATITITPIDVTDTELNDITGAKTCTVTVSDPVQETAPSTPPTSSGSNNTSSSGSSSNSSSSSNNTTTKVEKKSSNSKLDSLEISEGVLTPEFSSSVTEYELSVPNEITSLNVVAEADSSKATVKITGNEELQVGENRVEIIVTAEDGSKTTYTVLVKRANPELSLHALTVSYMDEQGEKQNLILNPEFIFNVYEYNIDTILANNITSLEVLGIANRENAVIEITGNENLKEGKNEIIVKVTVTDEAGLEEQKTYKITVEKEKEEATASLTFFEKMTKWFTGIGSTVSAWVAENNNKITAIMLSITSVATIGLTVYFIYDYKNHKKLLAKLAEYNKENLKERANVALDPEMAKVEVEEETKNEILNQENENQENKIETKNARGRRFK